VARIPLGGRGSSAAYAGLILVSCSYVLLKDDSSFLYLLASCLEFFSHLSLLVFPSLGPAFLNSASYAILLYRIVGSKLFRAILTGLDLAQSSDIC